MMVEREKRLEILQKVASGELSIDESASQLQALEPHPTGEQAEPLGESRRVETAKGGYQRPENWKLWWVIPVCIFSFLTVIAGTLVATSYSNKPFGVGFWFALVFLLLSIGGLVLSAMSSKSRWMHLRIHQKPGEKPEHINLSFPVPFKIARWAVHTFGHKFSGKVSSQEMDETLSAFEQSITEDEPMHVEVDDKDGTHVEIYIG